ncbi:tryptophan synthase subunit alpha [Desulforamulus ferrireducens]|uniref:Tryptophan synthase alpha chain n=1 Tax=Desulforamulus ferrireducens TaxID=1833852 RepID=A0A1S6IY62_9FIRM|nr:tryptophan synthase subunit alpha [Desulforamulus ferrireducens]AQS59725.1 tryptophan synthase subunit alpha [Desulforamulus ferrireducens]
MTGIEHLQQTFAALRERQEKALVTYVTAGDPDLTTTARLMQTMAQSGADIIELGVPFSDPSADGPVIQRASTRALANGTGLAEILHLVSAARPGLSTPVVLMSYYNPVLQYGLTRFCQEAAAAGVAGVIIPDLPVEEAGALLAAAIPRGIAVIPLVAPTSTTQRLAKIVAVAQGFIYCVTVTGITGTSQSVTEEIAGLSRQLRELTELPLVAGFGIATPDQAARVAQYTDGVVVGSALVRLVEQQGENSLQAVDQLTRELKNVLVGKNW